LPPASTSPTRSLQRCRMTGGQPVDGH
jgi:hypothetical protein